MDCLLLIIAKGIKGYDKDGKAILFYLCMQNKRQNQRRHKIKSHPLYGPKCNRVTLINAEELYITAIKEPDV